MMMPVKALCVSLILASVILVSGCNTVQGFGKDMQQGGQNLQQAATDDKNQ